MLERWCQQNVNIVELKWDKEQLNSNEIVPYEYDVFVKRKNFIENRTFCTAGIFFNSKILGISTKFRT